MFAAAICVSILLGVLVWALPGRLCDRRATHADVLAGPGIVLAVWIIAACVFAQPGLAQGFDLFRLLAINGAALWACGTVLLLRLRSGRRYRTLWTVAALLIAAIGLEVFVGNAPYFATHGYQPVDLRAYLQDAPADGEPIALNDEHSTLTFTGIHQPLYNVALDGVVYQYDGNYPQDQNPLFILWVSGTDEASTAPRQSWQWQAAPRAARSLVRTLDFSGAVDTLTLQAEGYSGEYRSYDLNYTVQAVLANVPRPMDFSLLRLAVVYLALLALWGLRPGAAAWHEAYLTHRAKYRPAVLVLGFGPVGQALGARLAALGANVTVCARRAEQRALAESLGLRGAELARLAALAPAFDTVVNTIPAPVLTEPVLTALRPGSLIVDLASKPGGTDFATAQRLGCKAIHALSLPAACAPDTAGEAVARTVLTILREREEHT